MRQIKLRFEPHSIAPLWWRIACDDRAMRLRHARGAHALVLAFAASCADSHAGVLDVLTADIDGTAQVGLDVTVNDLYIVSHVSTSGLPWPPNVTITLLIPSPWAIGSYGPTNGARIHVAAGGHVWEASGVNQCAGGPCEITVVSASAHQVIGTFEGELAGLQQPGSVSVTNGTFDVNY